MTLRRQQRQQQAHAGSAVGQAGDLLFELIDAASAPATDTCAVSAGASGAVSSVDVVPGATVYQGQLLCRISDLSRLELSAEMDEVYLSGVQVGDTLTFELDAFPGEQMKGTVTQIRPLGTTKQNAAYYDVRVSLPENRDLLPGMSATVYVGA